MNSLVSESSHVKSKKFRILIIGSAGWLGQFLYQSLIHFIESSDFEIFGSYHNRIPYWIPESHRIHLNLEDSVSVDHCITQIHPNTILHVAAISAPIQCEKNPKLAFEVNSPVNLISSILKICPDALMIYTSTDLVFDGEKGSSYLPSDTPKPILAYGETKLAFENHITGNIANGIVLRLSNMIGPKYGYEYVGGKFMQWLFESYQSRAYIGLRHDEIRSFVYVDDIVQLIIRIIKLYSSSISSFQSNQSISEINHNTIDYFRTIRNPLEKIFHAGGPIGLSRLDLATILVNSLPNTTIEIELQKTDNPSNVTSTITSSSELLCVWKVFRQSNSESIEATGIRNPRDVSMDSKRTEEIFGIKFTDMRIAIPEMLKSFVS